MLPSFEIREAKIIIVDSNLNKRAVIGSRKGPSPIKNGAGLSADTRESRVSKKSRTSRGKLHGGKQRDASPELEGGTGAIAKESVPLLTSHTSKERVSGEGGNRVVGDMCFVLIVPEPAWDYAERKQVVDKIGMQNVGREWGTPGRPFLPFDAALQNRTINAHSRLHTLCAKCVSLRAVLKATLASSDEGELYRSNESCPEKCIQQRSSEVLLQKPSIKRCHLCSLIWDSLPVVDGDVSSPSLNARNKKVKNPKEKAQVWIRFLKAITPTMNHYGRQAPMIRLRCTARDRNGSLIGECSLTDVCSKPKGKLPFLRLVH